MGNVVSSQFHTNELISLFSFRLPYETNFSICTDSRIIKDGQIFLPLVGEKFDGHDFINDIFDKRAINKDRPQLLSFCDAGKVQRVKKEHRKNLIIVANTLDAYHLLANHYRKRVNPKVIAITGSSGKTTVKDLVQSVLRVRYKAHKTEANFNNEIGVPKTILEMPCDTEILVLELAMRGKGEIKYLSKTAEPDIAVITNIGTAHVGRLGSLDSIAQTKCELLEHLRKDGLAVLHDDPLLTQHSKKVWNGKVIKFDLHLAVDISFKDNHSSFTLVTETSQVSERYSINALGRVHVLNSICVILLAKYLKLTSVEIQKGLLSFKVPSGRGNLICLVKDIYLVDESYNANPDSVRASVCNLIYAWGDEYKKILVLGELAELGEHEGKLLYELNAWLKEKPLSTVVTVGDKLKQITFGVNAKDIDGCCDILEELLSPKAVVLVKGSRVAKLEKVVEYCKNKALKQVL